MMSQADFDRMAASESGGAVVWSRWVPWLCLAQQDVYLPPRSSKTTRRDEGRAGQVWAFDDDGQPDFVTASSLPANTPAEDDLRRYKWADSLEWMYVKDDTAGPANG